MIKYLILTAFSLLLISCTETYTPKRPGYFRIDFPKEKKYVAYNKAMCPFTFEYADFGSIQQDSGNIQEIHDHPCWFNIIYPEYKCKIYLSYTAISGENTLDKLVRDSYKLTFKHTVKADYIDETIVKGKHPHVSGILYDVGGNAASSVQFYLTDSSQHFLRGSLYFFAPPNSDSIAPAVEYFRKDVQHLIETFEWR